MQNLEEWEIRVYLVKGVGCDRSFVCINVGAQNVDVLS